MNRAQADRRVIAARVNTANLATRPGAMPSTEHLRIAPAGFVGRRSKARMTGAQRSADGGRSLWTASPYYRTAATIDPRWSAQRSA